LLQEFRSQLNALSSQTGRTYGLTLFVPADPAKIDAGFDVPQIMQYVDYVTVQGYDFHGAWESSTMHQSNLYDTPGDPSPIVFSVNKAIQAYLNRGAPSSKLVVGVPFYGRGWTGVPPGPNGNGLFQRGTGPAAGTYENGIEDYKVIKDKPGTRYRDTATGALWLYDGNNWWSYDDPQLLNQKMNYVKNNRLGGAMFWELSGDTPTGELINAIYSGLNN